MTPDQKFLAIGVYLNSALYLAGCFLAGMTTGNVWAWKAALASAAFCYLAYVAQVNDAPRWASAFVVWLSVVSGMVAGIILLFDLKG